MKYADPPMCDLADRLPFCPRCMYALSGLPESHQCPECGLAYDAESRVWAGHRRKPKSERIYQFIGGCMGLGIGVGLMVMSQRFQHRGNWLIFWGGIANVVLASVNVMMPIRPCTPKKWFLALLPDGLWYMSQNGRSRSIPWSNIKAADDKWTPLGIAFKIRLRPRGTLQVPFDIAAGMDIQDAIARINAHVEKSMA